MKKILSLIIALYTLVAISCKPASNNKVFAKLEPSSAKYKEELTKQILEKGTANLTFIFNGLENIGGKDYINVLVNGNGIEAKSLVLVNNWNKLENIKRTKGRGYIGGQLKGLQLDISHTNGEQTLIYRGLEKVVD